MTKSIPTVKKYMTTCPHSIGIEQTISKADKMMRLYGIRHLPVLQGSKLFGIVSDRDIKLYSSIKGADPEVDTVSSLCAEDVFTSSPDTPLNEILNEMAEKKYGSVVIMDNNKLVGIFTAIDGLRAASELLETRLR